MRGERWPRGCCSGPQDRGRSAAQAPVDHRPAGGRSVRHFPGAGGRQRVRIERPAEACRCPGRRRGRCGTQSRDGLLEGDRPTSSSGTSSARPARPSSSRPRRRDRRRWTTRAAADHAAAAAAGGQLRRRRPGASSTRARSCATPRPSSWARSARARRSRARPSPASTRPASTSTTGQARVPGPAGDRGPAAGRRRPRRPPPPPPRRPAATPCRRSWTGASRRPASTPTRSSAPRWSRCWAT